MVIKVNLLNVESLSYCPLQNTLTLNFKSEFRCNYRNIPEKIFTEFLEKFKDRDEQIQTLEGCLKILRNYEMEIV